MSSIWNFFYVLTLELSMVLRKKITGTKLDIIKYYLHLQSIDGEIQLSSNEVEVISRMLEMYPAPLSRDTRKLIKEETEFSSSYFSQMLKTLEKKGALEKEGNNFIVTNESWIKISSFMLKDDTIKVEIVYEG